MRWLDKRFHSLNYELRKRYGGKVAKLSIDAGFTCPNRDGTIGVNGCDFCGADGAGTFAGDREWDIDLQIQTQKQQVQQKWSTTQFIGYYQSYTNTYAPVDLLRKRYAPALADPQIVQLAIATRPDCLSKDILAYLESVKAQKPIWVELGLQTAHEKTALRINRGYSLSVFEAAVSHLRARGIEVVVHVIFGLPGESRQDMLQTIEYLSGKDVQGIKIHSLHVLRGTALADQYQAGAFDVLEQDAYIQLVADAVERLPEDVVIHRMTGDGAKDLLIAPRWPLAKRSVLNGIDQELKRRDSWQGKYLCANK